MKVWYRRRFARRYIGKGIPVAKKWIALNILLLIAVFMLAQELYQQYGQLKTRIDPAKIVPVSSENQDVAKTASGASLDTFAEMPDNRDADYFIISEKTLFSDLRGNEEMAQSVAPKVAPLPNPKPVLVGVVMIDGQYAATVRSQTATTQARGAQIPTETWRVGDFYRGYRVESIATDQVVLENSGAREIIPLNRVARPAQQAVRQSAVAANVISIGPGGTASGALTVSTTSAPAPGRGAPTPAQNAAARQQAQQAQTQQTAAARQAAQQAKPQQAKPQQGQRIPVSTAPDGEVIISPVENVQEVITVRNPAQNMQQGTDANPAQGGRQQQQRIVPSPFGEIIRPGS